MAPIRDSSAGEPGWDSWKSNNNSWQTGGGAMWVTGSYDADTNQVLWGTGNPVPMFNPYIRRGNNRCTNSLIFWNPDSGKMNWYFQYTLATCGTMTRLALIS